VATSHRRWHWHRNIIGTISLLGWILGVGIKSHRRWHWHRNIIGTISLLGWIFQACATEVFLMCVSWHLGIKKWNRVSLAPGDIGMERVSCVHFGSCKARTDLQTQNNPNDTEANAFLEVHANAVVAPVHLNRLPVL